MAANRQAGAEWAEAEIGGLSDWQLIDSLRASHGISYPMEIDRRLKEAIKELTAETITFRKSSDAAALKLTKLTNWLIGFTAALVLLTVGVLILTAVLAANG